MKLKMSSLSTLDIQCIRAWIKDWCPTRLLLKVYKYLCIIFTVEITFKSVGFTLSQIQKMCVLNSIYLSAFCIHLDISIAVTLIGKTSCTTFSCPEIPSVCCKEIVTWNLSAITCFCCFSVNQSKVSNCYRLTCIACSVTEHKSNLTCWPEVSCSCWSCNIYMRYFSAL